MVQLVAFDPNLKTDELLFSFSYVCTSDQEFLLVHFRSALRHRWHSVVGYRNDSNPNLIVSD